MFQISLRVNFVLVTWLITAYLAYRGFSNVSIPYDQFQNQYGSFRSMRRYLGPFILLAVHLTIWFFALRKNDSFSRFAAFFVALGIVAVAIIIPLLRADTFEKEINSSLFYGGIYTSSSYMLYALFYRLGSNTTVISFR